MNGTKQLADWLRFVGLDLTQYGYDQTDRERINLIADRLENPKLDWGEYGGNHTYYTSGRFCFLGWMLLRRKYKNSQ